MSGALGGITLGGNVSLTGSGAQLVMTSGNIILQNNNLTLSAVTTIGGSANSVTNMIVADATSPNSYTGQLQKTFNTGSTGAFTFPVGDNSGLANPGGAHAPSPGNNSGADYSPVTMIILLPMCFPGTGISQITCREQVLITTMRLTPTQLLIRAI
jgi:hypothetical protein